MSTLTGGQVRPSQAQRIVIWLLAMLWAMNALAMVGVPDFWFRTIPGVVHTGPFNDHLVRDIGLAFATIAFGLFLGLARPRFLYPMLVFAAVWFSLHVVLHLWDTAVGHLPISFAHIDLTGTLAPALAHGLVLIWVGRDQSE